MSNLSQSPDSVTFYKGWYGRCDTNECVSYDLSNIKTKLLYVCQMHFTLYLDMGCHP